MPFQGIIYRIKSPSHPEILPYYGSTTQTLKSRFWRHKSKSNNTASRSIIIFEDAIIELLEEIICETKNDLIMREKYYIENYPCCNVRKPIETKEELQERQRLYRETHKNDIKTYREMHKEQMKEYYNDHKKDIREKQKIYKQSLKF